MDELTLLTQTPLFAGLPEVAAQVLAAGPARTYRAGETVFAPERFEAALGLVTAGALEVTRGAMRMDTLLPGALFGAAALFNDRGRYPTTLTARTESRVRLFGRALMEDLMAREPRLARGYVAYLSDRVAFLSDRLDALGAGPAADKLLCFLRERNGSVAGLSGDALAATLGMSRATLYRAIDALKDRGILNKTGKTLTLTDQPNKEGTL